MKYVYNNNNNNNEDSKSKNVFLAVSFFSTKDIDSDIYYFKWQVEFW